MKKKSPVREGVKWGLRKSAIDIHMPLWSVGFEVRRALRVPLVDSEVRRLLYFRRMFDLIRNVDGAIVECGVLHGRGILLLSFLAKDEGRKRKVWGFDSFEPLAPGTAEDKEMPASRKTTYITGKQVDIESVHKLLLDHGLGEEFLSTQVSLVKGYFEQTLPKFADGSIALLHLDVDLYDSCKYTLEQLFPRMPNGAVIMFDEYMGTYEQAWFPGAQKAIADFFGTKCSAIQRDANTGKYYLVKE